MGDPLIRHVSDTAFLVAEARARETERSDALFRDPLARRLAGDKGRAIAATFPPMTAWSVSMRTLVIDAMIGEAVSAGVRTVVNLGAGLDTRPYRMDLPAELLWVEADYPDVIAYKEKGLAQETPRCRLTRERLDLAVADERRGLLSRLSGARSELLVLTEGVVPYLDLDEASALAEDLHATANVVGWIVDYISPESHAYRDRHVKDRLGRAAFKFRPTDWFAFFAQHGWKPRELRYLVDEGRRVGRPPPLPWAARIVMKVLGPLSPPEKREAFRTFSGYAFLEPGR